MKTSIRKFKFRIKSIAGLFAAARAPRQMPKPMYPDSTKNGCELFGCQRDQQLWPPGHLGGVRKRNGLFEYST